MDRFELATLLTSGHATDGIDRLRTTGVLATALPEVAALVGVRQNTLYHPEGDVYTHVLKALDGLDAGCSVTLGLAVLLHDVGKPATYAEKNGQPTLYKHDEVGAVMAEVVLRRFGFAEGVVATVTSHVRQHMKFRNVREMRAEKFLLFCTQPNFSELLALHKLDVLGGSGNMEHADFVDRVLLF
jgi:poly(A) polymerase